MLTVAEAAGRARVCESIVRHWVVSGQLPHYRLGRKGKRGKIVIAVEDLDGLLASFKVSGQAAVPAPTPRKPKPVLKHLRLS